jgi:uncharacterized membrane protein YphA (DoxX/SURF4 family)
MTGTSAVVPKNRAATIGLWVLRILLALAFGTASFMKLSGNAHMVAEFAKINMGPWFIYFTGLTELTGVLLLLIPRTTLYGALVLFCVCIGAFVAQIGPLHGDVIHVFVLGALLLVTLWLARPDARTA